MLPTMSFVIYHGNEDDVFINITKLGVTYSTFLILIQLQIYFGYLLSSAVITRLFCL